MAGFCFLSMSLSGLRGRRHLPKQVRCLFQERGETGHLSTGDESRAQMTENFVPRWLLILGAIALIALIAGYVTFGGANMGR